MFGMYNPIYGMYNPHKNNQLELMHGHQPVRFASKDLPAMWEPLDSILVTIR